MHWKELKQHIASHATGSRNRIACPVCEEHGKRDRKRSMGINSTTGRFRCFRCGTGGRYRQLTAIEEAQQELDNYQEQQPSWFVPLFNGTADGSIECAPAIEYVLKRGVTAATAHEADLGVSFEYPTANRIVAPFKELDGSWWGYSARTYLPQDAGRDDVPKYAYPRGMAFGQRMYNQHALARATETPVIVVEGVFDTLALWPHSVALLGKPSARHMQALMLAYRPIVIVLDGDAYLDAWKLAMHLRMERVPAGVVRLPVGVDPDEVDRNELFELAVRSLSEKLE